MPVHDAQNEGRFAPFRPPRGDRGEALLSRRTELVLKELDALPTLPVIATRLIELGAREDVDVKDIVRLVETDPTLTARLLSLCKRAANRTRYPITTVEMAVVMLGLEAVRSLALSVQIFEWTSKLQRRAAQAKGKPAATSSFNRVGFWQHSIAVACCADLLAREHADLGIHPEEAFVCGIVHDLGKLALDHVLPRAYSRVIELAEARQGNISDFERPVVGMDHRAAGRRLAEHWGLPEPLADTMARHGETFETLSPMPHARTVALVGVADAICRRLGLGWSGNHALEPSDHELAEACGLNWQRIETAIARLYEATSDRCRDLGLGEEPSQQLLVESILRANSRLGRLNAQLTEANNALREAQRQLAEARAMARLGEMTAGAAHELNNPLAVISGRAQTLATRLKDERDKSTASAIVAAADRLTGLIDRLHRIANPPHPKFEPTDIGKMLEDVIAQAKGIAVQKGIDTASVLGIKLTVADGLEPAKMDRALLSEALIEIVVNAIEAGAGSVSGGGRGPIEVRVDSVDHDRLNIQIVDQGCGMSEHVLAHALDPFFSAKPAGRQTGLGLALAHRLIQTHEGEVVLSSKPGRGTTVSIFLPRWRWKAEAGARRPRAAA